MTANMNLRSRALKSIPCINAFSAFFSRIIVRCTQIRRNSHYSIYWSSSSACCDWRLVDFFLLDRFTMYSNVNINWIKAENVLFLIFLLILCISFLLWMSFEIIFNYACECCISDCCCYLFSALNACVFFTVNEFAETTAAESMIARLHTHRNCHYLDRKSVV